jgi:indoleamine 2,3-dioxygenase
MKSLHTSYTDGFFNVSAAHGFLPELPPLVTLPPTYEALQSVLDKMPVQLSNGEPGYLHFPGKIQEVANQIPNYVAQVNKESDIRIIQALYRGYAFLTSADGKKLRKLNIRTTQVGPDISSKFLSLSFI